MTRRRDHSPLPLRPRRPSRGPGAILDLVPSGAGGREKRLSKGALAGTVNRTRPTGRPTMAEGTHDGRTNNANVIWHIAKLCRQNGENVALSGAKSD